MAALSSVWCSMCETEEMGKKLRSAGVTHVLCWRPEVQDMTAKRQPIASQVHARQLRRSPCVTQLAQTHARNRSVVLPLLLMVQAGIEIKHKPVQWTTSRTRYLCA
jgi:hypothetical protein